MVLFGAELFTNAVEWFGFKLGLGQGAVGSVLAALGTALPETAVPVTAILFGGNTQSAQDVGIGGIIGAPFLLATLGSLVMAVALWLRRKRPAPPNLDVNRRGMQRDFSFFLLAYSVVLIAGCVPATWVHHSVPPLLVSLYAGFLVLTFRDKKDVPHRGESMHPLYLQWKNDRPRMGHVVAQMIVALCAIVGGAQLLTFGVEAIAAQMAIPAFVLSAILIPLTTELPETLNSVVWIRQGKDSLAVGNITGAMVFQSTLVPALGIWLTSWSLAPEALLTGALTLAAAAFTLGMFRLRGVLSSGILVASSLLYWVLPLQTLARRDDWQHVFWIGLAVIAILFALAVRTRVKAV